MAAHMDVAFFSGDFPLCFLQALFGTVLRVVVFRVVPSCAEHRSAAVSACRMLFLPLVFMPFTAKNIANLFFVIRADQTSRRYLQLSATLVTGDFEYVWFIHAPVASPEPVLILPLACIIVTGTVITVFPERIARLKKLTTYTTFFFDFLHLFPLLKSFLKVLNRPMSSADCQIEVAERKSPSAQKKYCTDNPHDAKKYRLRVQTGQRSLLPSDSLYGTCQHVSEAEEGMSVSFCFCFPAHAVRKECVNVLLQDTGFILKDDLRSINFLQLFQP